MDDMLKTAKSKISPPWERKARWALLAAFVLTVCYKLWQTPTYFSFAFAEALALTLAVFAVWLSLQFYFKAVEAASQMNDRTFQFMKDASALLGRIETALPARPSFPDPARPAAISVDAFTAKHDELERARTEQSALLAERDKIILDLLARANLRGADAQKYFNLLAGKEQLLHELARRQGLLEQQLVETALDPDVPGQAGLLRPLGKKTG